MDNRLGQGTPVTEVESQPCTSPQVVDELGYRGPTVCAVAAITYRQLDYWARTGLVEPTLRGAHGSGSSRLYTLHDIVLLRVVKRLLDCGISLQNIRRAITFLREHQVDDLAGVTLLSDGVTVWTLRTADDVFDVLQSGDAMYAIAVGKTVADVRTALADVVGEATLSPLRVVS